DDAARGLLKVAVGLEEDGPALLVEGQRDEVVRRGEPVAARGRDDDEVFNPVAVEVGCVEVRAVTGEVAEPHAPCGTALVPAADDGPPLFVHLEVRARGADAHPRGSGANAVTPSREVAGVIPAAGVADELDGEAPARLGTRQRKIVLILREARPRAAEEGQ